MVIIMNFTKTLTRNEMKQIKAGDGGLQGCYFECCTTGGSCSGGQSYPTSGGGDDCTSNEQCQSDILVAQQNPTVYSYECEEEGSYIAALCYS